MSRVKSGLETGQELGEHFWALSLFHLLSRVTHNNQFSEIEIDPQSLGHLVLHDHVIQRQPSPRATNTTHKDIRCNIFIALVLV